MNEGSLQTLFNPFETGLLDMPVVAARVLFINAERGFCLPDGFRPRLTLAQDLRPVFLSHQAAGHNVVPRPEGDEYDLVLISTGRHRGQNELWIAEALRRVIPGGLVVVAGGKMDGAASLRKRIASLVDVEGHAAKSHGVAFWFRRNDAALDAAEALEAANPSLLLEGGFRTMPGLFSHERIDQGSLLLADHLPAKLGSAIADFGAGWGYLSVRLAQRAQGVEAIDLYEASFAACEMARANMAALAPHLAAQTFWHDLVSEKVGRRYDTVVMNPPFHKGRAAEPSLGEAMIRAAATALRPGGRLYLVANHGLPYEATLRTAFSSQGEIIRDVGYKVLWAAR